MKTMLDGKTLLADNLYQYDGNGNRTQKQGLDGITQYSYDVNNRLVEVQYPNLLNGAGCYEKLNYDYAGNRIRRMTESLTEEYRYDNCNRLLQLQTTYMDDSKAETTANYTYDLQGNLLSDDKGVYQYDDFNRMTVFTGAEGIKQTNRYDAEGLRAEMEENGQLVQFLYSSREVVAETESDGNIIRYIRGLGLISSDSERAKTYYHYVCDEQGSVTHVTEGESKDNGTREQTADHQVLNHYTYDAFGNTLECEEQVHNRFRYLGEQYDPVSQQYYLRARYYNPVIGRFTQEDTYYGDGLNLYQYCANNPIRYKDPSGHCPVEQNPFNRYTDVGADPEIAKLAADPDMYPDLASKQHLINEYTTKGYGPAEALMLANYEIIHGKVNAENYAQNIKKTRPETGQPYDPNSDFRLQERLYEMQNGGDVGNSSSALETSNGKSSSSGTLGAEPYTIYRPDGGVITDVTGLPGAKGIRVEKRLTTENMRYLTQEYGVEFALVYQYGNGKNGGGGSYWLYSGIENQVRVPVNKDSMLIYHTHPEGYYPTPSVEDYNLMQALKASGSTQRISTIVPVNKSFIVKFDAKTYQKVME